MRVDSVHMRDSGLGTVNRYMPSQQWDIIVAYAVVAIVVGACYLVYSLDNVNLLHQCVTHVSAVERVICLVEAASEGVSQPVCAYLGQCVFITIEI